MKEAMNSDIQSGIAKIESQMGSMIESVKLSEKNEKNDSKN